MNWRTGIGALIFLTVFSLSAAVLIAPSALAQEENNVFTVSPPDIMVRDAPPMGEPWSIETKLVVWNRDDIERVIFVTSEIPPENAIIPGYEPIPNENWVRPSVSSFTIPENSYAEVQLLLNIPRWENLTGQKWEVWIPVERQPFPGEIGVLRPTVRMMIETTEELPPLSERPLSLYIIVTVGVVAVTVVLLLLIWFKRRE